MLDPRFVTDNLAEVKAGLARRGFKDTKLLDDVATLERQIAAVRKRMLAAADALDFEQAAELRDELHALERIHLALG